MPTAAETSPRPGRCWSTSNRIPARLAVARRTCSVSSTSSSESSPWRKRCSASRRTNCPFSPIMPTTTGRSRPSTPATTGWPSRGFRRCFPDTRPARCAASPCSGRPKACGGCTPPTLPRRSTATWKSTGRGPTPRRHGLTWVKPSWSSAGGTTRRRRTGGSAGGSKAAPSGSRRGRASRRSPARTTCRSTRRRRRCSTGGPWPTSGPGSSAPPGPSSFARWRCRPGGGSPTTRCSSSAS